MYDANTEISISLVTEALELLKTLQKKSHPIAGHINILTFGSAGLHTRWLGNSNQFHLHSVTSTNLNLNYIPLT